MIRQAELVVHIGSTADERFPSLVGLWFRYMETEKNGWLDFFACGTGDRVLCDLSAERRSTLTIAVLNIPMQRRCFLGP